MIVGIIIYYNNMKIDMEGKHNWENFDIYHMYLYTFVYGTRRILYTVCVYIIHINYLKLI